MPRRDLPDIYPPETEFAEGRGILLREGADITLIGCGIMVATCLQAAELLAAEGIESRVIDIVTVKPLAEELLLDSPEKTGAVVSAENASVVGGLGSAVAECLSSVHPVPVLKVGIQDSFGRVGTEPFLRETYGLTPESVALRAREALELKETMKPKGYKG